MAGSSGNRSSADPSLLELKVESTQEICPNACMMRVIKSTWMMVAIGTEEGVLRIYEFDKDKLVRVQRGFHSR